MKSLNKKMKKLLALICALAMVITLMPMTAATVKADDTTYTDGDGFVWDTETGTVLKGYSGSATSITIPEKTTQIAENAFKECTSLESIDTSKLTKLTAINSSAFYGCSNLTTFDFSKLTALQVIGASAFLNCTKLTSVSLPETITTIGISAFEGCSGLTSFTVNCKNLTSTGIYIFKGCSNLKTVALTGNPTEIPSAMFYNANYLESIEIPTSVTRINSSAFCDCTNLETVNLSKLSKLTYIGISSFEGCEKLTNVEIAKSVTEVNTSAFKGCKGLTYAQFDYPLTKIASTAFDNVTAVTIKGYTCKNNSKKSTAETFATENSLRFESIGDCNIVEIDFNLNSYSKQKMGTSTPIYPSGSMNDQTYALYGNVTSVTIKKNAWTSTGFTFTGWNTKADGKGTTYKNGAQIKAPKDLTLYAQWKLSTPATPSVSNSSKGLTVSWKNNAKASGYKVYRSVNGGSYSLAYTVKNNYGSSHTWTDTKATSNGKKYSYKVVAYYTSGITWTSSYSAVKTCYRVAPVTISSIKNSSSKALTLTWKKPSVCSGYEIQYSTSSSFSSAKKLTVSSSTKSKKITGLTKGKTYYVRIRTYKTVSGTKYYSSWSTKSVKISK